MTTPKELAERIHALTPSQMRALLSEITAVWWEEIDGTLNFDKQLDSDHLEKITTVLHHAGLAPTSPENHVA